MNSFLQMFQEEQKLLNKIKKNKKKNTPVFLSNFEKPNSSRQNIHTSNTSRSDSKKSSLKNSNSEKTISNNLSNLSNHNNKIGKTNSISSTNISLNGGGGTFKFNSTTNNQSSTSKGGVVVKNQSVVVKTNFEMAGRLNQKGKRPNAQEVGSHTSASMNYMDNHGANDIEDSEVLSNTYHENGDRMSKEELRDLQSDLKEETQAFRRIIIDVGQKDFDREDLNKLVRESMQQFKEETGKDFEYKFALHFDTNQPHAHVTAFGSNADINFTKEHLQNFKEAIGEKTEEITLEKELEQDKELSLNQKIDKELDGILDNKIENDHTQDQDNSKGLSI
jgi:hypothetical protein